MSTTFATLKTYASDQCGDQPDAKAVRVYERAVNNALKRIVRFADWSFYISKTGGRINFKAPYSTGTVSVSLNGTGATLAGGTWPTDAATANSKVIFSADTDVEFEVATRTSGAVIVFVSGQVWVASAITAGAYSLYYDLYSLPSNFHRFHVGDAQDRTLRFASPMDFFAYKKARPNESDSAPFVYTIIGDDKVQVYPYPSEASVWEFQYLRWPSAMTADADVMDWPERWLDVMYRAIDVELAQEPTVKTGLVYLQALHAFSEAAGRAWKDDSGRDRSLYQWGLATFQHGRGPDKVGLITDG